MKTLISLLLSGFTLAGAVLKFTTQQTAFVATLETSSNAAGPWKPVYTMRDACPTRYTFTVWPGTNESEFFRIRPHDNGIVPTPEDVRAIVTSSNSITISCPMIFRCNDLLVDGVRVLRSFDDGAFEFIGTAPHFLFTDTNLPPGIYSYALQAFDGARVSVISSNTAYFEIQNSLKNSSK